MGEGIIVEAKIEDPDIRGRIDALRVLKVKSSNDRVVRTWRLVNYQSTGNINLEDGAYYLKIFPYFINIDPLPVWFKVFNHGTTPLFIQCITTERKPGFKNIKKLKGGEKMDIAGCYRLEYRVVAAWLGDLGVQLIDGVGRRYRNKLVPAGILRVEDLAGKEALALSKIMGISVMRLTEFIRKAEIACGIEVDGDVFEKIGDRKITRLLNTPVSVLARDAGVSTKKIEELMDVLGNVAIAMDNACVNKLVLEDLFERG